MASVKKKQLSVLVMNTYAFTACFAVWVMFSIIGIPIKELLSLSETQFGLLVATPILTGSLARLPVGMLTDKFGGRVVYFVLMCTTVLPLWLISEATQFWHFLILGLFIGLAGASFSVGISYTAKWFPKERQGFAMGIFGAGNAGAALTKFVAPSIVVAYGWTAVPKVYAIFMFVTVIAFWMFTYTDPSHQVDSKVTFKDQLNVLKDKNIWRYCQYYSIVFGGFVALSLWMTKFYINEYGFDIQTAALLATFFVLPSGVIRALGGWFSDKYGAYKVTWWVMWISWVCLFLLSYPQTDLTVYTADGGTTSFHIGLNVWLFTALLFVVGIAWGFGKASVFKFLSDEYPENLGVVSGIVGLAGGLGGFLLPIMFGFFIDMFKVNTAIFMILYGATCVSLIWMHWSFARVRKAQQVQLQEKRQAEISSGEKTPKEKAQVELEKEH